MISMKGMGRFSLVTALLSGLLYLAGCSGVPLLPGKPVPGVQNVQPSPSFTWEPTPEEPVSYAPTEPAPTVTETTTEPAPTPTQREFSNGDNRTATFPNFRVSMNGSTGDTEVFMIQPEVCVVKSVNSSGWTQISDAPWTITLQDGTVIKKKVKPEGGSAYNFPETGKYHKGECASGWITFKTDGRPVREVGYANSLGNQALWAGDMTRLY